VSALLAVEKGASLSPLKQMGARINSVGAVISAEIPLSRLKDVGAWNGLHYAEAARRSRYLLDRSIPDIRADLARKTYHRQGKGVLIGLVDSGIDLHHPDFLNADGTTRIKYLWDQTDTDGPAPADFPFGREYTAEQINDALAHNGELPEKDNDFESGGHGTHVAGIAAGNGGGTPFQGVSPAADLIVVKWDTVHGLDANRYIAARAATLKMPVVINNSWGGQNGPHDGTDAESQGLSDLSGENLPGHVICFAAGNSGGSNLHIRGALKPGETGEVEILAPSGQTEFEIELWGDAKTQFRFGLRYPTDITGKKRTSFSVGSGNTLTTTVPAVSDQPYGGASATLDAQDYPYPLNPSIQRCTVHVDLQDTPGGTVQGLSWVLFVQRADEDSEGSGTFDGWITQGDRLKFDSSGESLKGDSAKTLVNQACAKNGIAVGAYISKVSWTAWNDQTVNESGQNQAPGDPSPFTSEGPTRDGQLKPELAAPGQWVASSLSGDLSLPASAERFVTPDGAHFLLEGTSMASPHVAGTIALLLEADPTLNVNEVKDYLKRGLRTSFGWSPKEGYGKLDAYEALRLAALKEAHLKGDLNGDGRVDLSDVMTALRMALGILTPYSKEIALADVSPPASPTQFVAGDGRITVSDVVRLLLISLNLEPTS
jgi:subtilisin family serine protease